LGVLRTLCRRRVRRAARHRGPDGLLSRGHAGRPLLLWVGAALQGRPSRRHRRRRDRQQFLGALDPDRQWLDAVSRRCQVQSRYDAHGSQRLHGRAVQSGGAGQVRPYRRGRLRHGIGLRAGDQRALSPAETPPPARVALYDGGGELRSRECALRHRAGRRERLHGERQSEDEDRRDRGDVEYRAGAGLLHADRHSRPRGTQDRLCGQDSVGAWPHHHTIDRQAGSRHRRSRQAGRYAHPKRTARLRDAGQAAQRPQQRGPAGTAARACRRSRLCAAPEALSSRCRARKQSRHRRGRPIDNPERAGAVLVVPLDGRVRLLVRSSVRRRLLPRRDAATGALSLVPRRGGSQPAIALDCRRTRLDRRRIWPPALGDRRCPADGARRLEHRRRQRPFQPARVRRLLFRAGRRRSLSDDQVCSPRSRSNHRSSGCSAPRHGGGMSYELLRLVWWALLGVLLIAFAVTDGFDLGSAALLPYVARNDNERRQVINTIGPVWEGNQVWFVVGGGAFFAAWQALYAASFSGFYLAMFAVLAALIFRPLSIIYRSKLSDPRWRGWWDWTFFVTGIIPSLVF